MAVIRNANAGPESPVRLQGVCTVEDAEPLAGLLLADPSASVDWTACTRMHTAVFQVLLRLRPEILGICGDPFVARWLTDIGRG